MDLPKIIAFYFPQFHAIPENDKWWGVGFNDWDLVKRARPNFNGHYQPRIPIDEDYYDPCDKQTLKKQVDLAKMYGIGGFMLYHYWFDGKLLLEKPLETYLNNSDLDLPYCICWANETWTRAWIGKPECVLQSQTHSPNIELWKEHFNYLLPFFQDNRALKIDNKPIIIIYQPSLIQQSKEMFRLWQKMANDNGLDGLYIMAIKSLRKLDLETYECCDGILRFQPRESYNSAEFANENLTNRFQFLIKLPELIQRRLRKLYMSLSGCHIYSSIKLWKIILSNAYKREDSLPDKPIFESAFFEWDNTPRYARKSKIFTGLSEEEMEQNMKELLCLAKKNDSPYVFFNAWNEWSESAYLEPDKKNGYKYLNIMKRVIDGIK